MRVIFLLCGVFAGVVGAKFGVSSLDWSLVLLIGLIALRFRKLAPVVFLLVGLNMGLFRGAEFNQDLSYSKSLFGENVVLIGSLLDDPSYSKYSQTEFHIGSLILNNEVINGRILIRSPTKPDVKRGDLIKIEGKFRETLGNKLGVVSYPDLEVLDSDASIVEEVRSRYFAGINTALPEPEGSLGLGFLIGLKTLLPEDLLDKLSVTGLTHIVAVSGYNLTVLVRLSRRLLAPRSARLATIASFVLMVSFITLTGFTPSIVRAAIVGGLALLAWYYGRNVSPWMLLLLGLALTSYINPFYPWFDIGWYLSFLAFFGVLIIAPLIIRSFYGDKTPKLLIQIAIETTCAQLMALPLIVVIFNELSLISILANVIILPFVPFAMLLTFFAGLFGWFLPQAAGWFAVPARYVLEAMTTAIDILSRVPNASIEISASWTQLAVFYAAILVPIVLVSFKNRAHLNGTYLIE